MPELNGAVAIVTGGGGTRSIGSAIVRKLAEMGAKVAITDISPEAAEEGAAALRERGLIGKAFKHDVRHWSEAQRVVGEVREAFGDIDILVNNAGVSAHLNILDIDETEWRRVLSVNLDGVFFTQKAVLPGMVERGRGRVINIASIAGKQAYPRFGHYVTSKFAVVGLTQATAIDLAPTGVTVNSVCPGVLDTPLHDGLLGQIVEASSDIDNAEQAREWMRSFIPTGRVQTTDDIAEMVGFLASDRAKNITGASFHVDGGIAMR